MDFVTAPTFSGRDHTLLAIHQVAARRHWGVASYRTASLLYLVETARWRLSLLIRKVSVQMVLILVDGSATEGLAHADAATRRSD